MVVALTAILVWLHTCPPTLPSRVKGWCPLGPLNSLIFLQKVEPNSPPFECGPDRVTLTVEAAGGMMLDFQDWVRTAPWLSWTTHSGEAAMV